MLKRIFMVIGLVLVLFAVMVVSQPDELKVQRVAVISAPADTVFAQVNNLRSWQAWSPWAKADPEMETTYTGPAEGVGAVYEWSGNEEVGAGSMTIIESRPHELVRIALEFTAPYKASNISEFDFVSTNDGTEVTWTMTGQNSFIAKAAGVFMNLEYIVGGQFENGLEQLRAVAEAQEAG